MIKNIVIGVGIVAGFICAAVFLYIILDAADRNEVNQREARCMEEAQSAGVEYILNNETTFKGLAGGQQYGCWVRDEGRLINIWGDE